MFVLNLFVLVLGALAAGDATENQANNSPEKDREAILAMAGTFEVTFHFQETVPFSPGYALKEPYTAKALEVVIVDEETDERIVLQHILQTKHGIIKHWRQDWLFENTVLWEFKGDSNWVKRELSPTEAKGTWTQRVFQVDDSPRYESHGFWKHHNGVSEWTSQRTYRPLPRREYTKRDDYNILVATNRQVISNDGWVHEQDNDKLNLVDGAATIIAREIGLNSYNRTEISRAAEARQWWRDNRPFWVTVRNSWDTVFARSVTLEIPESVEDKPLYRHMFALNREWVKDPVSANTSLQSDINSVLSSFGITPPDMSAKTAAVKGK